MRRDASKVSTMKAKLFIVGLGVGMLTISHIEHIENLWVPGLMTLFFGIGSLLNEA